ncbi:two component, sigma54 specific, transcriptional regulator, Fis family [Thermodesulfobacterium geofontis OPF15]|uniref:Two component, sigma54 specific, transcriptional regulator, Fis family n=1 Tax=Thermodesulfobacterium geofontis (strain OPF15) TaxID=795359 RepID=F8C272_THEGP|nr:sigma-54 dependent transcriptional regulator [Thermodesulfobacterium geofontis]AEH23330.1 two component, sigma54 specific, transcriptional regulator, Fis family [Thermodesulfobacterium geofontis OPF15]
MEQQFKILVVDDEKLTLKNLKYILTKEGYEVKAVDNGMSALNLLKNEEFDLVITDLKMDMVSGLDILEKCKEWYPDTEVIMITAYGSIDSAIQAMKLGAYHYITKPFRLDELKILVKEALEKVRIKKENKRLKEEFERLKGTVVHIITQNPEMKKILELAEKVAPTDCPVLILGETGTGKELLARYIHQHSRRKDKVFLAINCGAFTEELLANELFGHEKGAYTGAVSTKKGLLEVASGGTLFLDEITEMSPTMQVKFLRVLQEKEFIRLGGTEPIKVDVRIIAATNRDIKKEIEKGRFREDLYYRLNVISFNLPPLCQRKEDIPLLCYYFLNKYAKEMNKEVKEISEEAMELLLSYDYPGNVRELENIIARAVALTNSSKIELSHLPEDLKKFKIFTFRKKNFPLPTLEEQEKEYIKMVLKEVGGNKTLAAQILGIDRATLWRKLKKYSLENE